MGSGVEPHQGLGRSTKGVWGGAPVGFGADPQQLTCPPPSGYGTDLRELLNVVQMIVPDSIPLGFRRVSDSFPGSLSFESGGNM